MKINWKVRIKNKNFWLTIIPALFVLVHMVLKCFGIDFDFTDIVNNIINVIEALFVVLAILGIVNDPTTKGMSDSDQALTYALPKCDDEIGHDEED